MKTACVLVAIALSMATFAYADGCKNEGGLGVASVKFTNQVQNV